METTTTTTPTEAQRIEAARAIEGCGVVRHVAERLAAEHTPDLLGAWGEHGKRNPRMPPGVIVNAIRAGHMPPQQPRRAGESRADEERVPRWLREKLPEICDKSGEPHPAAVLAARRMEFRHGQLSVREHRQAICGAVEDFELEAAGAPIVEPD